MSQKSKTYALDWISFLLFLILVSFGALNIYSVDPNRFVKQLVWIAIGFSVGLVFMYTKKSTFKDYSILIYAGSVLLLAGLFVLGNEINGAKSWYKFGGMSIQPTEFAKFGTILLIANILSQHESKVDTFKTLLPLGITLAIPMLLITLQPDPGSALVYAAFILVFYREGLSGFWLLIILVTISLFVLSRVLDSELLISISLGISSIITILIFNTCSYYLKSTRKLIYFISVFLGAFSVLYLTFTYLENLQAFILATISYLIFMGLIIFKNKSNAKFFSNSLRLLGLTAVFTIFTFATSYIFENVFQDRHRNRFDVILKGEQIDPRGIGFNLLQAKTAIGSGGFTGKGFLKGTYTKGKHVPEQSTDYIFCTIGEEWGFLGSSIFIVIYLLFIARMFYVSNQNEDTFTRVFGFSVASIFLVHFTINVGMVIGIIPTIGIPLPFYSYGGSSLLGFCLIFFTFLSLNMQSNQNKMY